MYETHCDLSADIDEDLPHHKMMQPVYPIILAYTTAMSHPIDTKAQRENGLVLM